MDETKICAHPCHLWRISRAKELLQKGFYILRYHPDGSKPGDVWDILPEDTHTRDEHYFELSNS